MYTLEALGLLVCSEGGLCLSSGFQLSMTARWPVFSVSGAASILLQSPLAETARHVLYK